MPQQGRAGDPVAKVGGLRAQQEQLQDTKKKSDIRTLQINGPETSPSNTYENPQKSASPPKNPSFPLQKINQLVCFFFAVSFPSLLKLDVKNPRNFPPRCFPNLCSPTLEGGFDLLQGPSGAVSKPQLDPHGPSFHLQFQHHHEGVPRRNTGRETRKKKKKKQGI